VPVLLVYLVGWDLPDECDVVEVGSAVTDTAVILLIVDGGDEAELLVGEACCAVEQQMRALLVGVEPADPEGILAVSGGYPSNTR